MVPVCARARVSVCARVCLVLLLGSSALSCCPAPAPSLHLFLHQPNLWKHLLNLGFRLKSRPAFTSHLYPPLPPRLLSFFSPKHSWLFLLGPSLPPFCISPWGLILFPSLLLGFPAVSTNQPGAPGSPFCLGPLFARGYGDHSNSLSPEWGVG